MGKFKKIVLSVGILAIFMMCGNIHATTSISTSSNTVNVGDTITVNVNVSGVATWQLYVTSTNLQLVSGSTTLVRSDDGIDNVSKTAGTLKFKATSVGTATINVTGNSYTADGEFSNSSSSKSISVVQPAPQTPVAPATNTTQQTPNNNNNTNQNTTTSSKSSDSYLKSLILSVEGLNPAFSKNITNYSVNVGENVNKIDVKAVVQNSKATYYVTGNDNLKIGENTIMVKVTAENGTVKTYKINVIKSNDPVKADATLSSLIIEDVNLGQDFDPNVTEYDAGDINIKGKKLNIYAYPTNEKAKVEIIGNEDLTEGKNSITIRVTSENGTIIKDYVVNFNKIANLDKVDIYTEASSLKDGPSFWDKVKNFYNTVLKDSMTIILLYFFVWFEFIQVVYLYEQLKKAKNENAVHSVMSETLETDNKEKNNNARRGVAREQQDVEKVESVTDVNQEIEEINAKMDEKKSISEDNLKNDENENNV